MLVCCMVTTQSTGCGKGVYCLFLACFKKLTCKEGMRNQKPHVAIPVILSTDKHMLQFCFQHEKPFHWNSFFLFVYKIPTKSYIWKWDQKKQKSEHNGKWNAAADNTGEIWYQSVSFIFKTRNSVFVYSCGRNVWAIVANWTWGSVMASVINQPWGSFIWHF